MAKRLRLSALFMALGVFASGCRSTDNKLESELRARDNDISFLREELSRSRTISHAMEMELRAQRGEVPPGIGYNPLVKVYPLKTVTLGRQTGGIDSDGQTGDDALQVVLEPKDADNHSVKVPGTLEVQLIEIQPEGLKVPLSSWTITNDELSRSWRSGLLTTGYILSLPWKLWPQHDKLRVIVQFKLDDGRMFEAEKDFTVRIPAGLMKRNPVIETVPMPMGTVIPAPMEGKIPLPAPVPEKKAPEPKSLPIPPKPKETQPPPPAPVPPPKATLAPEKKEPLPPPPGIKPPSSPIPPAPVKEPSESPKGIIPGPNLTSMPNTMPMQVELVSSGAWKSVQRVPILPAVQLMKPTRD